MNRFAIVGVAGFVAPRHLAAIANVGGQLIAAHDIAENVGILDRYFPDAHFFTDFTAFTAFLDEFRPNYLSICTPNDLHAEHIKMALDRGIHVICEKPMVINPALIPEIRRISLAKAASVNTILQLRKMQSIVALKKRIEKGWSPEQRYKVSLSYITKRGDWYFQTWKGKPERSGGLLFNIGIHLFDLLIWLFGPVLSYDVTRSDPRTAEGMVRLEKADVSWLLSVDATRLPRDHVGGIYRMMEVDGEPIRFDDGSGDLHNLCYHDIVAGSGINIDEVAPSIELCFLMSRKA